MIFVTGDTHMPHDSEKLSLTNFPEQDLLTKADFLIVCGDYGGVWNNNPNEQWLRKWLSLRNYTTLFVDGNHENFDLLNSYPVEAWSGGKVHRISESIIQLMRGQVFKLQGLTFFTMGGAFSIDKAQRTPGRSWWAEEMPSVEEYEEAVANLERCGYAIDYIITHTAPESIMQQLFPNRYSGEEELNCFLEELKRRACYKHWYFGHLHMDMLVDSKHTALFQKIMCIKND